MQTLDSFLQLPITTLPTNTLEKFRVFLQSHRNGLCLIHLIVQTNLLGFQALVYHYTQPDLDHSVDEVWRLILNLFDH